MPTEAIVEPNSSKGWVNDDDDEDAYENIDLAISLMAECKAELSLANLDSVVFLFRTVLDRCQISHTLHTDVFGDLASALGVRFMYTNRIQDLVESLTLRGKILDIVNSDHALGYTNIAPQIDEAETEDTVKLAKELLRHFHKSTSFHALNNIIFLLQESLTHLPSVYPSRFSALITLADGLYARFHHSYDITDLNNAISLLQTEKDSNRQQPNMLYRICGMLGTRFDYTGDILDLQTALLWLSEVNIEGTRTTGGVHQLFEFANELYQQFIESGNMDDLNTAITLFQDVITELPAGSRNYASVISNLASALSTRFQKGGQQIDLDESISLHRQAVELFSTHPHLHPDPSPSLNNLAHALWVRFNQRGQRIDLDESISLHRQTLELRLQPHPNRSTSLNNLGNALWARFEQGRQRIDLDEAISLYRQALELRLPPHPDRSASLHNLATALCTRFEKEHQRVDLDEAISLHRQALELLLPPHTDRSASLNNLASALCIRFMQGGSHIDLDETISLYRQALDLQIPTHPNRSMSLNNLANALWNRFKQGGQPIDEAISLHRQALELRPSPHPDQSASFYALGNLLIDAYSLAGKGLESLDEAMSSFDKATRCLSQSPSRRLLVAKTWARHADRYEHISATEAYDSALQTLPQVAALSFDVQSRQEALTAGSDGLARDASRCAIRSGNLDKAIEFIEGGRSIFWSQVLFLRSPLDQLHDIAPELADKLQDIATALELGSHRDIYVEMSDNRKKLTIDEEASRLNRLNEEWAKYISEVRKLKGFDDFLRPPCSSTLKSVASKYPVVILVANDDASHCLVMTSINIHHIPLPNLSTPKLKALIHLIQAAVSQLPISRSFIEQTQENIVDLLGEERGIKFVSESKLGSSDGVFRFVLRILWDELVKPVINFLNIKKSSELPVLQWCPIGHFTFLPIHAAGCYDDKLAIKCASDYFISSYTPTIGALLACDSAPPNQTFKMMTVIQSKELPSTKRELENIRRHVSSESLIEFGVPGVPAGVEAVASRLSDASIVHFACHGKQDPIKPLNSGLKLDDGQLQISRIMKETMPNGSLAFLCACETAMGDQNLPDEAMSLGASLIFSGVRRVVATMWEMMDQDGPTIADAFYEELFRGPDGKPTLVPDTTKSAQALDVAVKKLRSQNVAFRRWVPFIHIGK